MKKILLNFAEKMISKEQMKSIKGACYSTCVGPCGNGANPDDRMFYCSITLYYSGSPHSYNSATFAPNQFEAERRVRNSFLNSGANQVYVNCC